MNKELTRTTIADLEVEWTKLEDNWKQLDNDILELNNQIDTKFVLQDAISDKQRNIEIEIHNLELEAWDQQYFTFTELQRIIEYMDTPFYQNAVDVISEWIASDDDLAVHWELYAAGQTVEEYFSRNAYIPNILTEMLNDLGAPEEIYTKIFRS